MGGYERYSGCGQVRTGTTGSGCPTGRSRYRQAQYGGRGVRLSVSAIHVRRFCEQRFTHRNSGGDRGGTADARRDRMGIRHFRELTTWQLADALETEVLRLVRESPDAFRNLKYRGQLEDAVSGVPAQIAEGFARRSPGDFCRFLDYALASLAETEQWLSTGIKRGYFEAAACEPAFLLGRRTLTAAVRLKLSQLRYLDERRSSRGPSSGHRTRRR